MSHYDCRECGAGPAEVCEWRKNADKKRRAYWSAEALKRRHAIEKTRSAHKRMEELLGVDAENSLCLGIVLDLAEAGAREAAKFAQADH